MDSKTAVSESNCPVCGGELTGVVRTKTFIYRACVNCGARGPEAESVEDANKLWNQRRYVFWNSKS